MKPYASCRHSHSAVEAAIRLHRELDPEKIAAVEVRSYKLGVKGHDHRVIGSVASAKLSTPYAVAAALLYGRADLTVFEPLDPRVLRLAEKVAVAEDKELTRESPQKRIAVVSVTMRDGTVRSERVDYARGEPENPMSPAELEEKRQKLQAYAKSLTEKTENRDS